MWFLSMYTTHHAAKHAGCERRRVAGGLTAQAGAVLEGAKHAVALHCLHAGSARKHPAQISCVVDD